ncbi:MAG: NUDIX hydrolase, partial [Actinomyces sp.]
MRTNQLALSRSATDRDAERRSEPGLLESLAAEPETRVLLVDARGRVALTGPAIHPDLPDDGLTPPSLIGSPGATAWEGPGTRSGWALPDLRVGYLGASAPTCCPDLTVLYMGRELADDAAPTGPA